MLQEKQSKTRNFKSEAVEWMNSLPHYYVTPRRSMM